MEADPGGGNLIRPAIKSTAGLWKPDSASHSDRTKSVVVSDEVARTKQRLWCYPETIDLDVIRRFDLRDEIIQYKGIIHDRYRVTEILPMSTLARLWNWVAHTSVQGATYDQKRVCDIGARLSHVSRAK